MIASIPYFESLLIFVGGLTLGVWVDALLRRFDAQRPSRAELLATLGKRSIRLSSDIGVALSNYEEHEFPSSIFAEIRSIYVEYEKYRLPRLKTETKLTGKEKLQAARAYLSHIGPLLRDGHYKEAKRVAKNIADQVRIFERPASQSLQGTEA